MKIYIMSSVDQQLVFEERVSEIVEDMLWAGAPYPLLEMAMEAAQDDSRSRDFHEPLQWEVLEGEDRPCWRATVGETSMHYMIREYDI
jgi:hypothetical protein